MCAIFGAFDITAYDAAVELDKMKDRGHDSSGLGYFDNLGAIQFLEPSKHSLLLKSLSKNDKYNIICHNRWSVSGKVCSQNTHPILSYNEDLLIVHNGIIENYQKIREMYSSYKNIHCSGDTDTEVIGNWLSEQIKNGKSISFTLDNFSNIFQGTWAILFLHIDYPNQIFYLVKDCPLYYENGRFASDAELFQNPYKLNNWGDVHKVEVGKYRLWEIDREVKFEPHKICEKEKVEATEEFRKAANIEAITPISISPGMKEKDHMLREIEEQATQNYDMVRWGNEFENIWRQGGHAKTKFTSVKLFGCGSSYNTCLLGKKIFEHYHIPVSIDYASEYDYFKANDPEELKIAVSQSGETADVKDVLKTLQERCPLSRSILLTNKKWPSCADYAHHSLCLGLSKEQAVAATKTFTATVMALFSFAQKVGLHSGEKYLFEQELKTEVSKILGLSNAIRDMVKKIVHYEHIFVLGSGLNYPIAREIALKLKEVANVHAEATVPGEQKHGMVRICNENNLSIFLIGKPGDEKYNRILGNAEQVKSRGSKVMCIGDELHTFDYSICIPGCSTFIQPLVSNVAGQLLAYWLAKEKGLDVDYPDKICKTVTVY